jgi:hypothetical protein
MENNVLDIVRKIQIELAEFQEINSVSYDLIEYKTNGFVEMIEYCGITLWDSENDGLIEFFDEEINEYNFEMFQNWIKQEINKFNKILSKIKL